MSSRSVTSTRGLARGCISGRPVAPASAVLKAACWPPLAAISHRGPTCGSAGDHLYCRRFSRRVKLPIPIPTEMRRRLGIEAGGVVAVIETEDGILISPREVLTADPLVLQPQITNSGSAATH